MMMVMLHQPYATLLDHNDIMYSPIPAVHRGLSQSAGGSRRLPLPPPGLSRKGETDIEGKGGRIRKEPEVTVILTLHQGNLFALVPCLRALLVRPLSVVSSARLFVLTPPFLDSASARLLRSHSG